MSVERIGGECDDLLWNILHHAHKLGASDLHLRQGGTAHIRIDGEVKRFPLEENLPESPGELFLARMWKADRERFLADGQVDFMAHISPELGVRVNLFRHRGGEGAACRLLTSRIPTVKELCLPSEVARIARAERGLVLVTGVTGSGKSSTLAAMVDHLNESTSAHILTIEDPVEFVHRSKQSLVTHREIGRDALSYPDALRAALREDPDVILVGELRDVETISLALTAAETGHLVLATLHTRGAVSAVNRMIDVFPARQQQQARAMLAESLTAVISQELVRRNAGGRAPCVEVLTGTPAVRALIREGKTHQIESVMQTSASSGMRTRAAAMEALIREQSCIQIEPECSGSNRFERIV